MVIIGPIALLKSFFAISRESGHFAKKALKIAEITEIDRNHRKPLKLTEITENVKKRKCTDEYALFRKYLPENAVCDPLADQQLSTGGSQMAKPVKYFPEWLLNIG